MKVNKYSIRVMIIVFSLIIFVSCTQSTKTSSQSTSLSTSPPWSNVVSSFVTTPISPPSLPALSTSNQDSIDKSIVMVWGTDKNYSTGLVVGNGSQVLTAWNFEDWSPTPYFNIVVPGGKSYKAYVQAFDSRTSMTLLKVDGMYLPTARISDLSNLISGQEIIAREWNLNLNKPELATNLNNIQMSLNDIPNNSSVSFSISYPASAIQKNSFQEILPGAIVTDNKGYVLGLEEVTYNDNILAVHLHAPPAIPPIPAAVASISQLGALSSPDAFEQPWANAPLQAVVYNGGVHAIFTTFFSYSITIAQILNDLETKLGAALSPSELQEYQRMPGPNYDGYNITVIYAFPVSLRSVNGKQLATAKWIGIQWNRKNQAPNRLFYGNESSIVEGGFNIIGSVTDLNQAVSQLMSGNDIPKVY